MLLCYRLGLKAVTSFNPKDASFQCYPSWYLGTYLYLSTCLSHPIVIYTFLVCSERCVDPMPCITYLPLHPPHVLQGHCIELCIHCLMLYVGCQRPSSLRSQSFNVSGCVAIQSLAQLLTLLPPYRCNQKQQK